uniref:RNA-directed DNA polymerase n=1 Tax=Bactrocera latifrons TaxID=174628 RepID=A0A0K8WCR6_BACLA
MEVLAVVESVERFRVFLLGTHFVVRTDCNAVVTTKEATPLSPRIARWWLRLQEFDFTCKHRAGVQMQHVDALSRAPGEPTTQPETVADCVLAVGHVRAPDDWVYAMQIWDESLKRICKVLQGRTGEIDEATVKQLNTDYELRNGRLFRKVNKEVRLVVPHAVRWRVTKACHDDVGHFALEKILDRLMKHFWFPRSVGMLNPTS